jgi:hypothetical protein
VRETLARTRSTTRLATRSKGAGRGLNRMKDGMKTIISVVAALAVVLAFAATSYAQSSVDGYNDSAGQIQQDVDQGGTGGSSGSPVSADSGGSLPFTGLDVALLAAAGGLLVAAGFGMRRLTRATARPSAG